ncbi:peroxisomal biogenesis factor 2 [Verticillium alfalfae VaMs.102]|uniref:Peroxisomal biogenesis factor 2 n=1 Tax=Verticillium alfalfae (strain VaMs.102 / ATCC MYA-4576 / FGSC 10136) TaxID=526221 RepID=C9SGV1_VERA1|nr:peroxisomal biogenesis factor 2 [Verticillium alfalfae VaMs.102]EEY17573.1 peroxisomal biogenesis factor 2 [Verticillium alfalfae VaMs.102]
MRLGPRRARSAARPRLSTSTAQLVWHAFTEFLLFVLPLVGIHRWRRWFARTWRKTKGIMQTNGGDDDGVKRGEFAFLPERTCAICYQDQNTLATENEIMAAAASSGVVGSAQTDITNPYETMPCGCVYCFVCLATRLEREEGEGWTCLRCGELVKECKPWSGDVLETPKKSPSSKVVAFSDEVDDAVMVDDAHDDTASSVGDESASFDEAETHE